MTLEIVCPNCNYSRRVPRERIPPGVKWAVCPRCRHRFALDLPPLQEALTGATGTFDSPEGTPEEGPGAGRGASPWEERGGIGFWQGLYRTFKAVLFSPGVLFRDMTVQGGLGAPLAFGLLLGGIGTMFGFFWQFLMVSGSLLTVTGDLVGPVGIGAIFIGLMVLSPLYVLAGMFLSAGILHLCLLAVRGGCNGFEGTFRVVAYSQATQVISLIPFVGGLGAWIWNLVVQIVGLKEIHEITYGRVVLALLIPVAVLCLLGLAGVILALVLAS